MRKRKLKKINWQVIRDIVIKNAENDESSEQAATVKVYSVSFMSFICLVLTVMNIAKHYTVMTCATGFMTLGFAFSVFLYTRQGMVKIANYIVAVLVAVIFTFFAIMGKNEGFAILWILLVPMVASNVINLKLGLALCTYFQLLLFVMFYSPLKDNFTQYYTDTFIMRYPVLYFAGFIVAFIIVIEKEYFSLTVDRMAHVDVLTGASNRREYEEVMKKLDAGWDEIKNIRIFSMDLNGLKRANDTIGHQAGDELLIGAVDCLTSAFIDAILISRTGGDEFMVITEQSEDTIDRQLAHLSDNIRMWRGEYNDRLTISIGSASKLEYPDLNVYELANVADQLMYEEKRRYYETAGIDRRKRRTATIDRVGVSVRSDTGSDK